MTVTLKETNASMLSNYVREHGLNTVLVSKFGSHIFGLEAENSDCDYFVVTRRKLDDYLALNYEAQTLSNQDFPDYVSAQFMDVKKFFEHADKSNFTVYTLLFYPEWKHNALDVDKSLFSQRKLAHHALGLIDNKRQRPYMAAYANLFVRFLMENRVLPSSLHYTYLLDSVEPVPNVLHEVFDAKRRGVKDFDVVLEKPYTHDELNVLDDNQPNYNKNWMYFYRMTEQYG